MYNLASSMKRTEMMIGTLADCEVLQTAITQCLYNTYTHPLDPYPTVDYREATSIADLDEYFHAYDDHMGLDTEADTSVHKRIHNAPPWCLTYSLAPGTGRLIRATRTDLLAHFNTWVQRYRPLVSLHNALYDLGTARHMGVILPRFIDTMLRCTTIQRVPKGLKPFAYRVLHMAMNDFDDVTIGPSNAVAMFYLSQFIRQTEAAHTYAHTLKGGPRKGQTEMRRRESKDIGPFIWKSVNQARKALDSFSDSPIIEDAFAVDGDDPDDAPDDDATTDDAAATTDVWKRWDGWKPEVRATITDALGGLPFPRKSITWVPFPDALMYAVRDADASYRALPEVRRRIFAAGRVVPRGA
jgi:hypothetical protein